MNWPMRTSPWRLGKCGEGRASLILPAAVNPDLFWSNGSLGPQRGRGEGMDEVLLVTGGSRGIGAATALLAARKGWAVAVNYTRNEAAAQEVGWANPAGRGRPRPQFPPPFPR